MKFKELIISGIVCLLLISGTLSLAFSDIKGHWAEPNIKSLEEAGIINGYGDNTFKPDINMSRGEASKIMIGVLNINPDGSESNFADLGKGHWAYSYVSYLSNKGIINGYGDKTFRPNSSISRAELAKISYGILKDKSSLDNNKKSFKDSTNHWANIEISLLAGNHIIDGDGDGYFRPDDDITRAEASKIIYNTIKKIDPYRLIDYFILTNGSEGNSSEKENSDSVTNIVDNKSEGFPSDLTGKEKAYLYSNQKIIANKNSGIFHAYGQRDYEKILVENAIIFETEEEAISAGYRKAKR